MKITSPIDIPALIIGGLIGGLIAAAVGVGVALLLNRMFPK